MKSKKTRLMAYIYMPLIFTFVVYLLGYVALKPYIEIGLSAMAVISSESRGSSGTEIVSGYTPPNFSADSQKDVINAADIVWPNTGTQYGQIVCEKIGLDVPLYFGDDYEILRVGAGQYASTLLPGFGGLILIAAHNTTFFNPLQNIEQGDVVTINTSYGIYGYKVTETRVVNVAETEQYPFDLNIDREQLVMYTCYPFDMMSSTDFRFFVYADKVSGPDAKVME